MKRRTKSQRDPTSERLDLLPPDNDWSQVCYFRKRYGPKWHKVIHFYPRMLTYLSYCGRLETIREDKMLFVGEWNSGDPEIQKYWIECETCTTLDLAG